MKKNKYLNEYKKDVLRAVQLKQLDILSEVDRICSKYDIPYWLDAGTLLGARRHGGFIPWDDDLDISMKMEDYRRLAAVAKEELPENLVFQPIDAGKHRLIAKVRDLNSFFLEWSDNLLEVEENGVYIDIFPFVDYPSTSISFIKNVARTASKSYSILHKLHHYSLRSFAEFFYFSFLYIASKLLFDFSCVICKKDKYTCSILTNNGMGVRYSKKDIFPLSTIEFEGKTFPAPHNVDSYLTDIFGDFMQMPPEDKRKIHAAFMMPKYR